MRKRIGTMCSEIGAITKVRTDSQTFLLSPGNPTTGTRRRRSTGKCSRYSGQKEGIEPDPGTGGLG